MIPPIRQYFHAYWQPLTHKQRRCLIYCGCGWDELASFHWRTIKSLIKAGLIFEGEPLYDGTKRYKLTEKGRNLFYAATVNHWKVGLWDAMVMAEYITM